MILPYLLESVPYDFVVPKQCFFGQPRGDSVFILSRVDRDEIYEWCIPPKTSVLTEQKDVLAISVISHPLTKVVFCMLSWSCQLSDLILS